MPSSHPTSKVNILVESNFEHLPNTYLFLVFLPFECEITDLFLGHIQAYIILYSFITRIEKQLRGELSVRE